MSLISDRGPAGLRRRVLRRPILISLTLVLGACGGGSGPATVLGAPLRAPAEADDFYMPPQPLPDGAPGSLIWAEEIDPPDDSTEAWRILYRSETVGGEPTAVSGLLFAPADPPAGDGLPILAVAHGTTGLADRCAPSRLYDTTPQAVEMGLLPVELRQRFVVVATDYEGLGTPGVHPYAVGLSEGRSVLDSIRAAQQAEVGAGASSPSVVWGHSQGGGAALLSAELAPTYAPDANVRGVAAGAPASELRLMAAVLRQSPFFGYLFMAGAGFQAAYPDVDLSPVLTVEGFDAVERAGDQCGSETIDELRGQDPDRFLQGDPATTEPFASLLEENSPGVRSTSVPIFLYHGEADEQIPVVASQLVLDRYCANGTTAMRRTWPDASHAGVVTEALPEITAYLEARLAGEEPPTSC